MQNSGPDETPRFPSLSEILSRGVALYRSRFSDFLSLTLALALPANFLMILGVHNDRLDPYLAPSPLPIHPMLQSLLLVAGISLTPLFVIATILISSEAIQEREMHWKEAFHRALRFWPRTVFANLLAVLYVALFSLLLVIPGIARAVSYSFINQAVAIRNKGILESPGYSRSLVKGRWWIVFFALLLAAILPGGYLIVLHRIVQSLQNPGLSLLLVTLGSLLVPFYFAVETELYFALERHRPTEKDSGSAPSLSSGKRESKSGPEKTDRNPYG